MKILFTGGSGTLGRAVFPLLRKHEVWSPPRAALDVTDIKSWERAVDIFTPETIVHAAAYTKVDQAERERDLCYAVNVLGTKWGVRIAKANSIRFLYVSTDYVFDGEKGNYEVGDTLGPVNYYALTKALAEVLVQEYEDSAIIRTSFAPDGQWRYPRAWDDLWTGKEYVSTLAPEYALAIQIPFRGIVHIVGERKTLYDLAKRSRPDVIAAKRADAPMPLPKDVSLNIRSWEEVKRVWKNISRSRSSA
jgi:dTDP-4-dehydrorhamnose reductase